MKMQREPLKCLKMKSEKKIPSELKQHINEMMKDCDLVIVCRKSFLSKFEVWFLRLIFSNIEHNPLSPVFGYKGRIYSEKDDKNLMKIIAEKRYNKACVIKYKVPFSRRRWRDVIDFARESGQWKIFVKFVIVGVFGIIVNLAFFFLFYKIMNINDLISLALAIEMSILITFLLNDRWVFLSHSYENTVFERFVFYHLVLLVGMILNIGVYYPLSILGVHYLLADGAGIVVASVWSFYMNNVHVFARKVKG